MQSAKHGDTVLVHYIGSLEDGTVFDSSEGGPPISFTIGSGEVIPGFEEAIIGMSEGDQKRETITADRGYGVRRDDLLFRVGKHEMPDGEEIEVGDVLRVGFPDGSSAPMQVAEIDETTVTLDANHPLAGKTLVFDLTLVTIGVA
jgi:peptidylprolyl isomerase